MRIKFKGENLLDLKESQMRDLRGNKIALIPQDPMTSLNPLYTVGNQLIDTYTNHFNILSKCAKDLTVPQNEVFDGIQKLRQEIKELKASEANWKQKVIDLNVMGVEMETYALFYNKDSVSKLPETMDALVNQAKAHGPSGFQFPINDFYYTEVYCKRISCRSS